MNHPPTVMASGSAVVPLRPSLLLMLVRVRVADATLELGLAKLKQECKDAAGRLLRLGAARVDTGDPYEDVHADADPMERIRSMSSLRVRPAAPDAPPERPAVNATITARWEIAALSVEEIMLLVDRLRFEAAAEEEPEAPVDPASWTDPQSAVQAMQAMMERATNPPEDRSAKFLYVARAGEGSMAQALGEAFRTARQRAEVLAAASGRRIGELTSMHSNFSGAEHRSDKIMEHQRILGLLDDGAYRLVEGEFASSNPRSIICAVTVHATYRLEPAT